MRKKSLKTGIQAELESTQWAGESSRPKPLEIPVPAIPG